MRKLFTIFLILAWLPLAQANDYELSRKASDAYFSKDYKTAIALFKPLAEEGNTMAQYYLAGMYRNGQGVPQNYEEALKWYLKSAEQGGSSLTYYALASMYDEGVGTPKNSAEATKWYRKSAEQNFSWAQSELSMRYASGKGVSKNYIQAYVWASIAKANGNIFQEDSLKSLEKEMTFEDIAKAQDLATKCWESKYQNCGE